MIILVLILVFSHTHLSKYKKKSKEAKEINIEYYPMFNMPAFLQDLDVIVLSVPLIQFAEVVTHLPTDYLRKKLIVEVCPLNTHPKTVLLSNLPQDVDIICSHPMFSPNSCKISGGSIENDDGGSWDTLPFVYEKVRVLNNPARAQAFLDIFSHARCKMVEMTAEQHDVYTANAEFVTHLTGRILNSKSLLPPAPIVSKEYELLKDVAEMTDTDSFDLFYGMFKFNEENAKNHMREMRERLSKIEMQLAAKEAYLAAKAEIQDDDRQRLIEECKTLFREVAKDAVQRQHIVTPTIEDVIEESASNKK